MALTPQPLNFPTSQIVVPADASVEGVGSGMEGSSCSPGIGVATAVINPKVSDWSQEARTLVVAPLGWGGDSEVTGQLTADIPDALVVGYEGADFNDTPVLFTAADAAAAPGAVYDTVSGAVNLSADTTAIGDWLWGAVPVV